MPQPLLNRLETGSLSQQMGRKGMAQAVGRNIRPDPHPGGILLDDLPEALTGHLLSPAVDEKPGGCLPFQQLLSGLF